MTDTQTAIQKLIDAHKVLLFMKGDKDFPQCGFSGAVVQVLDHLGADFNVVNVLEHPEIREGIKVFSNWPTIPQLYIEGEFVGGCDIVRELYQDGELKAMLQEKNLLKPVD